MTRLSRLRILAVLLAAMLALSIRPILQRIIQEVAHDVWDPARVQELVNQGRAAMSVGEYDRAVQAFGEALAVAPNDEDVKTWYAKARRYQDFAAWYEEAEAAIAGQRWDEALDWFEQIAALDPTYEDVSEKIEFVKDQLAPTP